MIKTSLSLSGMQPVPADLDFAPDAVCTSEFLDLCMSRSAYTCEDEVFLCNMISHILS